MSEQKIPVLVVGAGPTGLMMACELVRHGVAVRIVDRAEAPATTSRALVIQPRTLEIYDDIGVLDAMHAAGQAVTAFNVVFDPEHRYRLDFAGLAADPATYSAHPSLYAISQHETERVLTEHLRALGVEIERGQALTDLAVDDDGVTATLHHSDGTSEEIRTSWLIGCDGAHSTTRGALGIPFEGSTYPQEFIMADARLDWALDDGESYVFPSKAGFFAAFKMPGPDHYRIFGNVPLKPEGPSAEYSEPTHAEFQSMMDERLPVPAKVTDESWVSRYRLHARSVPRYRQGRVFLVGDAAHVHSPAGAQGMNTGIQDAYNLAWKLALVHRGLADDALLDSYHDERHPQGERLLKTTDRMFAVISGQSGPAKVVRGTLGPLLARRLLTRASFLRWFLGIFAQLRIGYPDSPLNREDGSGWHDAPKPGERAREADLLGEGAPGRIFDVLRGTHHTVLLFTGIDDKARRAVELCRVAEQLEHAYSGLVTARVISTERFADHPAVLADPDRAVHRRWGVESAAAFVIRPDAYIGYRGRPIDADALAADLATRLPGRSLTPAA